MTTVSIEAFFRTGSFGPVQLGMSRKQVQEAFGAPDDVGLISRTHRQPSLWKYGDIELHFALGEDELWLIHLDAFQIPQGGGQFTLDPWIVRKGCPRSELESHLTACSLLFQQIPSPDEDYTWLRVGAGVVLVFLEKESPFSSPLGLSSIFFLHT